ncbi:dihydrofolate reductase [Lodderomyces elongisporus]|uniref:Serine hydrolase domain-containing protein n=1 Tax=Lodderomyces elongisporus (strain ATCC 11503 / CBS 2605 / JCM 1781 / NBRC 1676 / NRRL YB-4239) TaxID=379508 RepID=A5E033_LODEL|nr:dihydrofolate reductase [Lodderomyces elongisporus]EDK44791.1 conserved hypothetical protein [Lodderomyces elongisporus NRRL YB-4239]WLF80026.1 dihydrofolate reductase [Lodderomyces elongisporus]
MSRGISKVLCLPGYLQSGATFAKKSSGLRKALTKQLGVELDYIDPCQTIESQSELGFPLAATEEESKNVWNSIVESGNNRRWFEHQGPSKNAGLDDSIQYIIDHINNNGPYDGIIGFSQGAAMAIMVTNSLQRMLPAHPPLKIGLFISGFCLTKPSDGNFSSENKERIAEITDLEQYKPEVVFSSDAEKYLKIDDDKGFDTDVILVYGENDSIVPAIRSKYVSTLYPASKVHFVPHDGAHYVPNQKPFVRKIVELFDQKVNEKL